MGKRFFSSPQLSDRFWSPLGFYRTGTKDYFNGVKWPRREADHSPSSAEVKNTGAIPHPNLPIGPHGVVLNSLSVGTFQCYNPEI
jgi:hypothetical protein